MNRLDKSFLEMLDGIKLETLEEHEGTIFGLSAELRLIYFNPSWVRFALENEGEPAISQRFGIGTPVADALEGEVRQYYLSRYRKVLESGQVWHHNYECSAPDLLRIHHQSAYPLAKGQGLIVVTSTVREEPHDPEQRRPHDPLESIYLQEDGLITQCSNCRRTRRVADPEVWDWVPAWVEQMPPNVSHSICKICYDYYYANLANRWTDDPEGHGPDQKAGLAAKKD